MIRILLLLPVVLFLTGCSSSGYFLNAKQKGQLIGQGRIQEPAGGDWYDVTIVPGYAEPARNAKEGLADTGEALGTFVDGAHWKKLGKNSKNALKWGWKDSLYNFGIKGSGKAWKREFQEAGKRVDQRVFGWWMAYPWATLSAGGENAFRLVGGAAGAVTGTAWGGVVQPAWAVVDPALESVWHLGVDTVLFPGGATIWNTVAAPPLALAGQRPSPQRADGFWVRQISPKELADIQFMQRQMTKTELDALETWARQLVKESQELANREKEIQQTYRQTMDQATETRKKALQAANAKAQPAISETLAALPDAKQVRVAIGSYPNPLIIQRLLQGRLDDLNPEETNRLRTMLPRYLEKAAAPRPIEKTDPLKEVIKGSEVLK